MQEDRQTTKEEGSKEEDRQEGDDVKKMLRMNIFFSFFLYISLQCFVHVVSRSRNTKVIL